MPSLSNLSKRITLSHLADERMMKSLPGYIAADFIAAGAKHGEGGTAMHCRQCRWRPILKPRSNMSDEISKSSV